MIKALYEVEMKFKCDKTVFDHEVYHKLAEINDFIDYVRDFDDYTVMFGLFDDYNVACKTHFKVKEVLTALGEQGLIIFPLQ